MKLASSRWQWPCKFVLIKQVRCQQHVFESPWRIGLNARGLIGMSRYKTKAFSRLEKKSKQSLSDSSHLLYFSSRRDERGLYYVYMLGLGMINPQLNQRKNCSKRTAVILFYFNSKITLNSSMYKDWDHFCYSNFTKALQKFVRLVKKS